LAEEHNRIAELSSIKLLEQVHSMIAEQRNMK